MIKPSIDELTQGKYNRYTLVVATAKCARIVTDEYVKQREIAEEMIARKETDKTLISLIDREYRNEKAVKIAIRRLHDGYYRIVNAPDLDGTIREKDKQEALSADPDKEPIAGSDKTEKEAAESSASDSAESGPAGEESTDQTE